MIVKKYPKSNNTQCIIINCNKRYQSHKAKVPPPPIKGVPERPENFPFRKRRNPMDTHPHPNPANYYQRMAQRKEKLGINQGFFLFFFLFFCLFCNTQNRNCFDYTQLFYPTFFCLLLFLDMWCYFFSFLIFFFQAFAVYHWLCFCLFVYVLYVVCGFCVCFLWKKNAMTSQQYWPWLWQLPGIKRRRFERIITD